MTSVWLPPEEYLATLPKATMYGCLFFTDSEGRPLQLRSSVDPGLWQFPGGNTDPGETPWQTAVRETREETGIVFTGRPRLLATHFLPPGGVWTLSKVGFVFDGGTLTDEALSRIVLDPAEHCEWQVRSMEGWAPALGTATWERLAAVNAARATGVPAYLETTFEVCM
ncbi:NUDIX domain-containing protein [Streptomyces triculaminicus]|uniref:NUDIX domain-containing protein n=1 Tax=Streptomyces triculaminicus TaxID=2816232 RepID=UPI0037CD4CA9